MASHIRYVVKCGGGWYGGKDVFNVLASYRGLPVKTRKEVIEAAQILHTPLWILREPRRIKVSRSRYKKICQALGLGKKVKKQVVGYRAVPREAPLQAFQGEWAIPHAAPEPAPPGAIYGRGNQQVRFAPENPIAEGVAGLAERIRARENELRERAPRVDNEW
jgi:hypothetical protein